MEQTIGELGYDTFNISRRADGWSISAGQHYAYGTSFDDAFINLTHVIAGTEAPPF